MIMMAGKLCYSIYLTQLYYLWYLVEEQSSIKLSCSIMSCFARLVLHALLNADGRFDQDTAD